MELNLFQELSLEKKAYEECLLCFVSSLCVFQYMYLISAMYALWGVVKI